MDTSSTDKYRRIYLALRILILISLILLLYVIRTSTTYECELCHFEIEGKEIRYDEFMSLYSEQCLKAEPLTLEDYNRVNSKINFSKAFEAIQNQS